MANAPINQVISHVPIPWVCSARIISKVEGSSTYWVRIDESQLGKDGCDTIATPMYQPGGAQDYKPEQWVKALVVHHFNIDTNKFEGVARMYRTYILGLYEPEAIIDSKVQNPMTEKNDDRTVISHKGSQGGIVLTDNFELTTSPGGSITQTMKAFGEGIYKNSHYTKVQNFHRVISHSDEKYFCREHFGLFDGKTSDDESTNVSATDFLINYRRFVQQTKDASKWVSICEGAYSPWVGANNSTQMVVQGKDVLFTRIVNSGTKRITCEMGEPGDAFFLLRIDEVKKGEYTTTTDAGATPGVIGNRFKIGISDEGAIEVYAAGKGIPISNTAGFKLKLTSEGELTIQCAKSITLTHGDADKKVNSIVIDPDKGVDITAVSGFRVNGKLLLNENFLNWFVLNAATFAQLAPPNATIATSVLLLEPLKLASDKTVGILTTTSPVPVPASGISMQVDPFETVPIG